MLLRLLKRLNYSSSYTTGLRKSLTEDRRLLIVVALILFKLNALGTHDGTDLREGQNVVCIVLDTLLHSLTLLRDTWSDKDSDCLWITSLDQT